MSVDMNKPNDGDLAVQVEPAQTTPYVMPRVNLLPPEIAAAHALRRTKLLCGLSVLGVLGLMTVGYGLAIWDANRAADELATQQATTQHLNTEKGKYSRVTEVRNQVEAAQGARQIAMQKDVLWAQQINQIVEEMPVDLTFRSMSVAFDDATDSTNPLADPDAVGTITVEAVGPTHLTSAAWLEAEGKHPGFSDPYYSNSSYVDENGQVRVSLSSTVRFTSEIYSGRYESGGEKTAEAGKGN